MIAVLLAVTSRSPIESSPLKPSVAPPGIFKLYVPAGTEIVVPGFRFAFATAPRKLQSFGATVQAEAAAASSVRSTVMVAKKGVDKEGGATANSGRMLMRWFLRSARPALGERLDT